MPTWTALFKAAKGWDIAPVKTILAAAPDLAQARDPRGRTALHIACAVKPGSDTLGELNGIKTVTALLKAGAGLEELQRKFDLGGALNDLIAMIRRFHIALPNTLFHRLGVPTLAR